MRKNVTILLVYNWFYIVHFIVGLLYNLFVNDHFLQIEDGDIYASINQRDGMVSFHQNPEKYNNPKMLKKLDDEV